MKLSQSTISFLKNFSKINRQMVFIEGNSLYAFNQSTVATVDIAEEIPHKFGINDLNVFLSAIQSFPDDGELEIDFSSREYLTIIYGSSKINYGLVSDLLIEEIENQSPFGEVGYAELDMKECLFTFELPEEELSRIMKVSASLGVDEIHFTDSEVVLKSDRTINSYEYKLPVPCENEFELTLDMRNLLLYKGNYQVNVFPQFVEFVNKDIPSLKYIISVTDL